MKQNLIGAEASLLEALGRLNALSGSAITLFVTDVSGRLLGTLTDGDIRRALLGGASLDSAVTEAMHTAFRAIGPDDSGAAAVERLRDFRSRGIRLVPRLDADGRPVEIIDLGRTHTRLPLRAILMAGGKGERLRPLTLTRPKPLLEIDGKAIIDYNIEALAACGITDITACVRYMAEQIEEHFAGPVAGVDVKCVREEQPLGTIGAATLCGIPDGSDGHTLVMNSDLLTTISFEEMYLKHIDTGADATIAVVPYQVTVPFAILDLDGERVSGITEKPSYSHYANAGIYIFSDRLLGRLRPGERADAPDLLADAIADGMRVSYYVIRGSWIDVGSPADFSQARELMRHHRNFAGVNYPGATPL